MRKKQTNKRTGIFGGLFDPPHIGHLIVAQAVLEEFHLNRIIFVPAGNPPHKSIYSSFKTRCTMTKLAIKNNRQLSMSTIEHSMRGKTYTIDVIRELRKVVRGTLYLIIGSDQWSEIQTWRAPHKLFRECKVIVLPRPGYRIRKGSRSAANILISHSPLIDISSTLIRKKVKRKNNIQYLVPRDVHTFIKRNRLYRN